MEKKIELKVMRCPTCGGELKVEKENTPVECVYCGNTVTPVTQSQAGGEYGFGGEQRFVKIDGIKTASSALAHLDLFCEEFDWASFALGGRFTVPELDRVADTLKTTSADNYETWIYCYRTAAEPFLRKAEYCKGMIDLLTERYQAEDPDAYSLFDMYKRISASIRRKLPELKETLQKYKTMAEKYEAPQEALDALPAVGDESIADLKVYKTITDIDAVRQYDSEKDARAEKALAEKGINAQETYEKAKALMAEEKKAEALDAFISLGNYKDAARIAGELNHFFVIDQVLEIGKHRFVYTSDPSGGLQLFATQGEKVLSNAILSKVKNVLTVYADTLFYIDTADTLHTFNVRTKEKKQLNKTHFEQKNSLMGRDLGTYYIFTKETPRALCKIDLKSQTVTSIDRNVKEVLSWEFPYIMVTATSKKDADTKTTDASAAAQAVTTKVINVETGDATDLGKGKIRPAGYIDNKVVYTVLAPTTDNRTLYIRALKSGSSGEGEALRLEKNIYAVNKIFSGMIYYSVGNASSQTLIGIRPDGTGRREISLHIKDLFLERGGWLYFERCTAYNSVLFRSRPDGSEQTVICKDFSNFVDESGGYLYFTDDSNYLKRVRLDGSGLQTLCAHVQNVLTVRDDCIVYTARDGSNTVTDSLGNKKRTSITSVYATDFNGNGRRKLAYNVLEAEKHDDNTVYYIKQGTTSEGGAAKRLLYAVDLTTCDTSGVLTYSKAAPAKKGCYVATCVYGSYDCPEVWTLRRFRDEILGNTLLGRLFIALYYAVSPTLVRLFGGTRWFRFVCKRRLDRLVASLHSRGVADSPYDDRLW